MPLCIEQLNEDDELVGIAPSTPPLPRCLDSCCEGRSVKLQIRVRYAAGFAALCAQLYNGSTEVYHTQGTNTKTYKAWDSVPGPDTLVRTCEFITEYNTGDSAIKTWNDPEHVLDCGGADPVESESPEGCLAELLDPPADYSTLDSDINSYGGETGTQDDTKAAAIGALVWDEWSDWEDVLEIEIPNGSSGGDYLSLLLASSSAGTGTIFPSIFEAHCAAFESQLRVLGVSPLHIAVSEGEGTMNDVPVVRYTLSPGTPLDFASAAPSFAPGWVTTGKWLRCVCPPQFAPPP